jgi:hypothetical protein
MAAGANTSTVAVEDSTAATVNSRPRSSPGDGRPQPSSACPPIRYRPSETRRTEGQLLLPTENRKLPALCARIYLAKIARRKLFCPAKVTKASTQITTVRP